MKPDEQKHLADRLLDAGLKQYADAEPRPGLEDRILANLRAEQDRLPAHRWWPKVAVAAAALLIAVALWFARKPEQVPHHVAENQVQQVPAAQRQHSLTPAPSASLRAGSSPGSKADTSESPRDGTQAPSSIVAHARIRPHPRQSATVPKLDQFPSARPLSEQEKLLLAYVQQTPKEELLAVAAKEQQEISNLHIEKLVIPPLDIEKPTSESNKKN